MYTTVLDAGVLEAPQSHDKLCRHILVYKHATVLGVLGRDRRWPSPAAVSTHTCSPLHVMSWPMHILERYRISVEVKVMVDCGRQGSGQQYYLIGATAVGSLCKCRGRGGASAGATRLHRWRVAAGRPTVELFAYSTAQLRLTVVLDFLISAVDTPLARARAQYRVMATAGQGALQWTKLATSWRGVAVAAAVVKAPPQQP